jgi:dTDP-4-dehydrorhamnose reductase
MKILLLGHNGMLGHMILKYFIKNNIEIQTMEHRWETDAFKNFIKSSDASFLINCIGAIPQKIKEWENFKLINIDLPIFLAKNFKGKILHPTTDCEFNGDININKYYKKNSIKDANDNYGISKAYASLVLEKYKNVKQLRTSIIGPELYGKKSLMEWLINEKGQIYGFSNHYWNGITTLEWAKQSLNIIKKWNKTSKVVQLGTKPISKYELLDLINNIYFLQKKIIPRETESVNKCLKSDFNIKSLKKQLEELRKFYE